MLCKFKSFQGVLFSILWPGEAEEPGLQKEGGMKQMCKERERQQRKGPLDIHLPGSLCTAEILSLDSVTHFSTFMINSPSYLKKIHLDFY